MMFYAYAAFIFNPAVAISDLLGMEIPRISVVLRRVFDLLEAEPEPPDRPEALAISDARGEIALEGVTFTYPGDEHPTLHEVSVRIPAGKQVAVMGPSGAGKSTLLYLLMRFYDPQQGRITLDGHDLTAIKLLQSARARHAGDAGTGDLQRHGGGKYPLWPPGCQR